MEVFSGRWMYLVKNVPASTVSLKWYPICMIRQSKSTRIRPDFESGISNYDSSEVYIFSFLFDRIDCLNL